MLRDLWKMAPVSCALVLTVGGCADVPIDDLRASLSMTVTKLTRPETVAIDFLWVIDNSTSMCEEQQALAHGFGAFVRTLEGFVDIDARVAVTTMDPQCSPEDTPKQTGAGVFNRSPATTFGGNCESTEVGLCSNNADCGDGPWKCYDTAADLEACRVNPNGTINSRCYLECGHDGDCQDEYPGQVCMSGSALHACEIVPDVDDCPEALPAWLGNHQRDLFHCLATVGVHGTKCYDYEEGLRAALLALEPTGPNAAQANDFLREDAHLVVIFVSDEDDCSVIDGATLEYQDHGPCAGLNEADHPTEPGPLLPVSWFVNRLKSLKQDPSKVFVAAIGGDSNAPTPGGVAADRAAYLRAKFAVGWDTQRDGLHYNCWKADTYICNSDSGVADWARRYQRAAAAFGPVSGAFGNLCREPEFDSDATGFNQALETVARQLGGSLSYVCLPKQLEEGGPLRIVHQDDQGTLRELGYPADYQYDEAAGADCGEGAAAIRLVGQPLRQGESLYVHYQADPFTE